MSAYDVRQLSESHRPLLLSFLRQDKANNQFLIGDVATFGVRGRRIAFWGAFRGAHLVGAAMLLDSSACLYAPDRDCLPQLVPLINSAEHLSGEHGLMRDVLACFAAKRVVWQVSEHFCRLESSAFQPAPTSRARLADTADLPALAFLYGQNDGFRKRSAAQVLDHLSRQLATSRYFVAKLGDRIVSAAAVVAETEEAGMIVSVFTEPEARGRGHAASVVSAACADLLERGRTPYLFYREDNDVAGRLYQRLGFNHIGRWLLAKLSPVA